MVQLERISGWHDILCKVLADGVPFSAACMTAMIPAARVYNEMNLDPKFKQRVESAQRYGRGERGDDAGVCGAINGTSTASARG